jgi:hypothetical protein
VKPESLWAALWSDGRCSVFSAPADAESASRHVTDRRECKFEGWPRAGSVQAVRLCPVQFLELGVSSRQRLNAPKAGRVRILNREISWSGPNSSSLRVLADPARAHPIRLADITVPPRRTRLWSYVQHARELVLFNASNFELACCWIRECFGVLEPGRTCERIERVELHLAPDIEGFAPTCYRLWVDGYKVGRPGAKPIQPGGEDPSSFPPLAAEACQPVPQYSSVDARGGAGGGDRSVSDLIEPWIWEKLAG